MAITFMKPSSLVSSPRSFWKFIIIFVAIILVGYAIYVAAYNIAHRDEIQRAADIEKDIEAWANIYRNDKAGGSTPQETLNLFIAALEKNDVDLATSYFMPDDSGSREKWQKILQDTYDAGNFQLLAQALKKAQPNEAGIIEDKFYLFTAVDDRGEALAGVSLQFNGHVWKIDSL
jgi:hypothetical protein